MMQSRRIRVLLAISILSGLAGCKAGPQPDGSDGQNDSAVSSSFSVSYLLYQQNHGYGSFYDLSPTEYVRQFRRDSVEGDQDYAFQMQAPASATDPRMVLTLAKTSPGNPEDHEIAFRFFVPANRLLKAKKVPCHFGYTRRTGNCDVYSDIRNSGKYPFLPSRFQETPLRCLFRLTSDTLDVEKLIREATRNHVFALSFPGAPGTDDAKHSVAFRFECFDTYNQVVAAGGLFGQNTTHNDPIKPQDPVTRPGILSGTHPDEL